jgi:hypothetical protein
MLKYFSGLALIGLVAFGAVGSFRSGIAASGAGAGKDPSSVLTAGLEASAAMLNLRKGEKRGDSTLLGARVAGRTLILDYRVDLAGKRVDTAREQARLRQMLKGEACKGPMAAALRRGAAMEVNYWVEPKVRLLLDLRIDGSLCPA